MDNDGSDKFAYNRILWGIIKRHGDYIRFCENNQFDEQGWLITKADKSEDTRKIKQRFGISMVLHHEIEADEWHLTNLFRNATRAVTRVLDGVDHLPETHIRVDVDTRAPWSEITKELAYWLILRKISRESARNMLERNSDFSPPSYKFSKFNPESDIEAFKVWDLHSKGMKPPEIVRTLWPGEYQESAIDQDMKYKELLDKYKHEGFKDFDERAYEAAYTKTAKKNTLLKRVEDKKRRMISLFDIFKERNEI